MDSQTQLAWDWMGTRVCDPGENEAGVICPWACRPWHHLPRRATHRCPRTLTRPENNAETQEGVWLCLGFGETPEGVLSPGSADAGRSTPCRPPQQHPRLSQAAPLLWGHDNQNRLQPCVGAWLTVALLKGHCYLMSSSYFPGTASTPHPVPRSRGHSRYLHSGPPPCPLPARLKASQSGSLPGDSGFRTEAAARSGGMDS